MKYLYRLLKLVGVLVCVTLLGYTLLVAVRRISDGGGERIIIPRKTSVSLLHTGKE